jgi:predicted secreted acid phosphatase
MPSTAAVCEPKHHRKVSILAKLDCTASAVRWALSYLGAMHPLCIKPCIVLDIDGTVLLNEEGGGAKCVLFFHRLCQACENSGIAIFAVTARPDSDHGQNRAWTESQLRKCGISPVEKLFMRPPRAQYAEYKFRCRQCIRREGHTVLLSIGDQFADLGNAVPRDLPDDQVLVASLGDDGGMTIKLPSEF